jgi:hypothetical protein
MRLRGRLDGCGDERGDQDQSERLVELHPPSQVRGPLGLVAKRPGNNAHLVAEPDVMQPDRLAEVAEALALSC